MLIRSIPGILRECPKHDYAASQSTQSLGCITAQHSLRVYHIHVYVYEMWYDDSLTNRSVINAVAAIFRFAVHQALN